MVYRLRSLLRSSHVAWLGLFTALFLVAGCQTPRPTAQVAPSVNETASEVAPDRETTPRAKADEAERIPLDPAVRYGTLPNGMTYYVRANMRPANRAELRLVVNAGSILEEENQRGLAHFVEHMAFNGTERFAKQELVDYLELLGSRFGPDLNAYTSFDETVYLLQLPTDSAGVVETGLDILTEWASNVAFEDEEIDKERGVVLEELRLGRGASARIRDAQFPTLLQGSRYAERLPIGTVEVVENAPYERLRSFYRDWYRPDLMAVIAVGDFDPEKMEADIRARFAPIQPTENPRPRPTFSVPDHEETLFAVASDPEATSSSIGVVYKHPPQSEGTDADYHRDIAQSLASRMFNSRLGELTQDTDPPFIVGGAGLGSFVRDKTFYNLNALVPDGGHVRALTTLLIEAERVRRYGFTQSELDRARTGLLRAYERAYNERDKSESRSFASEYVQHYLEGTPAPGIAWEYEAVQAFLPSVTLNEVNALTTKWLIDDNRVITASGPEKQDVPMPTEADLLAAFVAAAAAEITPYEDSVTDAPLVATVPTPGTVVETEVEEAHGVTRLTLSNGVQVVMKPTDFKNDEVLMAATSPGGTSLVEDAVYTPASFAAQLIGQSGVGAFGPIELQKKLTGKVVQIAPSIGERSEGFRGGASPQDVETLLQLVHLFVTAPRADSTAYVSYRERIGALLANMQASPEAAFSDTISVTMTQNHPRRQPFSMETLSQMNLSASLAIYQDRFADLSDFTFYFVGAFKVEEITPLVATWLGSLPNTGRTEEPRDVGVRPPEGLIEKTVYKGLEAKSQVRIIYTGPATWSLENRRLLDAMTEAFQTKLREVLREDLGGTYGVGVRSSLTREPYEGYRITINFGCDPERADELIATVQEEINQLRTEGTTDVYVDKIREQTLRGLERNLEVNGYWLSILQAADRDALPLESWIDGPPAFMGTLTPVMIQDAARQYFDDTNRATFVLYPEGFQQ